MPCSDGHAALPDGAAGGQCGAGAACGEWGMGYSAFGAAGCGAGWTGGRSASQGTTGSGAEADQVGWLAWKPPGKLLWGIAGGGQDACAGAKGGGAFCGGPAAGGGKGMPPWPGA
ncbi:hypothetical protein SKB0092_28590 [Roseomonas mucosa]